MRISKLKLYTGFILLDKGTQRIGLWPQEERKPSGAGRLTQRKQKIRLSFSGVYFKVSLQAGAPGSAYDLKRKGPPSCAGRLSINYINFLFFF
jgi:hypothetical protein